MNRKQRRAMQKAARRERAELVTVVHWVDLARGGDVNIGVIRSPNATREEIEELVNLQRAHALLELPPEGSVQ